MTLRLLVMCSALILTACKSGPGAVNLDASAQFFLDNGGLTVVSTQARPYTRPCLRALNLENTLLGGLFGDSKTLVDFVDKHRLARLTRSATSSGQEKVVLTPISPYEKNWLGEGALKNFCFGTPTLLKVEAVPDAQPITADADVPYIIPGTPARAARLTFRMDGVPEGGFTDDLKARPGLLLRTSMQPDDYGKEFTVIATLPVNVKNYKTQP
ncbi:hypothetical protein [Deinococcus koreensis]|uniref:Lipoprotein n=1 Tax=Deinococcus koreensis TaxID=2054903 RepID=A0A2K3URM3_9DEIO|nr:hypothetical protein [Deinococcus koreensis]PNY79195.1 hypothetical protein CVO96_20565 [Deinococcus koreensis]